ncbi:MAG TPA: NAD(P)/FAD-dependent oxidoreductase [Acidimicrobiales bacterium]|jgi:FAD-dependent urate hydroxylase
MEVLVAGAGPGGLAAALGLIGRGHQVEVVDRLADPGQGGGAVTIYSNGAAALDRLGVCLGGLGAAISDLALTRANGQRLLRFDFGPMTRRFGQPIRTIPRADLLERLRGDLPAGVVRDSTAIDSVQVTGARVEVVLATGERLAPQIVVGADGHRSVVRRDVLDPNPAAPSGWATWQGLSPVLPEVAGGTTGRLVVGEAGLVGLMPAGGGLLQWWFDVRWSPQDPPIDRPADWLRDRFSGYAPPVNALLGAISDEAIGFFPHVVHEVRDQWGAGPVTLLGDAAHVFPPSQAQGANQAFEDAWLLVRALDLGVDPVERLRRYERSRARRLRLVSRMAASERTNRPTGRLLGLASQMTPAAVAGRAYAQLIRRFSSVLNDDEP